MILIVAMSHGKASSGHDPNSSHRAGCITAAGANDTYSATAVL
jgi:hypothetical protein